MAEAVGIARGLEAGDFSLWNPSANLGFPSLLYYQSLPQLVPAVTHIGLGGSVSILTIYKITLVLPFALLPITVYRAARVFDPRRDVALGAAAAVGLGACCIAVGVGD